MNQELTNKILEDYDGAMADFWEKQPPPKCHFTYMEYAWTDYEAWFECKHCGHTEDT